MEMGVNPDAAGRPLRELAQRRTRAALIKAAAQGSTILPPLSFQSGRSCANVISFDSLSHTALK